MHLNNLQKGVAARWRRLMAISEEEPKNRKPRAETWVDLMLPDRQAPSPRYNETPCRRST